MVSLSAVDEIIEYVTLELIEFVTSGETATIIIHCGPDDIAAESNRKRKHKPVQIVRHNDAGASVANQDSRRGDGS